MNEKDLSKIALKLKKRREELGLSLEALSVKTGLSKSTLQRYETGGISNIPLDKLETITIALKIPITSLLENSINTTFTKKDEKDIAKKMNTILEQIDTQEALMFDGEPLDEESKELLKASLENSLRMAKLLAKQKYTPKKYKK